MFAQCSSRLRLFLFFTAFGFFYRFNNTLWLLLYTYDRVQNDEVLQRTCLTSVSHHLSRQRISVFGHVARLDDDTEANMALQLHINVSLNRPPDRMWRHPPGHPRNKWLDQLRNNFTRPIGKLWRRAVDRGHGGATTRRPSPAARP